MSVRNETSAGRNGIPITGQGLGFVLPLLLNQLQPGQPNGEGDHKKDNEQDHRSEPRVHDERVALRPGGITSKCSSMQQKVVQHALVTAGATDCPRR